MDVHRPASDENPDVVEDQRRAADQSLGDGDQTLSDRDQTLSDRDQQASDDDQAASDRDFDYGGDPVAHARTQRERAATSGLRDDTAGERDLTGRDRDLVAERRDELARLHDELAQSRDEEADGLDQREDVSDRHTLRVEDLRAHARATRLRAAEDRDRAALDRERAAEDRSQAAHDRAEAARERENAGLDELTGASRRGVGLEQLANEIERARREQVSLVTVYADVDGLKGVNDQHGHAAGDRLLESVVAQLRARMRSYDLLVRLGGDEFLCALPGVGLDEARPRFADISSGEGSVSLGFSELRDGDSADDLILRADESLLAARRNTR